MNKQRPIKKRFPRFALALFFLGIITNSCEKVKTYEEGPVISLRSKMKRMTGTWELASYEVNGAELHESELSQMKIIIQDESAGEGLYKAEYHSFYEIYCDSAKYYTGNGSWSFIEGSYAQEACGESTEELKKREGIKFIFENISPSFPYKVSAWKILRLTNKELIIYQPLCDVTYCLWMDWRIRRLTFNKISD